MSLQIRQTGGAAGAPAVPTRRASLNRPPRDQRLDIVRGLLQLSIFAKHIGLSFIGGWVIHSNWGFSDSSELFVFLSGYTLGSVFALKQSRDGWRRAAGDLLARTWRLYRIHLGVFVLFGAMIALADATLVPGEAERLGWSGFLMAPLRAVPGMLSMLYQPAFMGILPTFVWSMLLLPGFALLLARFGDAAMLASVGLYLAVPLFGLHTPSLGLGMGVEFDPLAWQVLFLGGAWLGRRALLFGQALALAPGWARLLDIGAALLLVAGVLARAGWYGFTPWSMPFAEAAWLTAKAPLAVPRLLHAIALAWLVARCVPRDAGWMHTRLAAWLACIGRVSLEVFCLGLFLAWIAAMLLARAPESWAIDLGLSFAGFLALGAYARWLGQRRATL